MCPAPVAKYFEDGEFLSFIRSCSAPEAASGLHTVRPPLRTPSNEAAPRDRRAWAWRNPKWEAAQRRKAALPMPGFGGDLRLLEVLFQGR